MFPPQHSKLLNDTIVIKGAGQNVPMPKRTQPKRTQFWSKRTHFFGQNVPTFLVKTYPFHQNVPNLLVKTYPIYFFLISKLLNDTIVIKGAGQNVPMPKRTQPKRTQFWSKRTHFFGQNVPTFLVKTYPCSPKRTQPFGQNVPNIFFPDFQYFLLFG